MGLPIQDIMSPGKRQNVLTLKKSQARHIGMDTQTIRTIALDLGAKPRTVTKWRERHVPWKWRLLIEDEAKRRGLEIDRTAFDRFGTDAPAGGVASPCPVSPLAGSR